MARGMSSHPQGNNPTPGEARAHAERRQLRPHEHHHHENSMPGLAVCPRCHAIWQDKRWHLDEAEYQRLQASPDVEQLVCSADIQIEREEFDGEVTLQSPLILANHETIVGLIRNTEAHLRLHNPMLRIARIEVTGDTISVLTIGSFLAERIGKELHKAYDGQLQIQQAPRANFKRVMWFRE